MEEDKKVEEVLEAEGVMGPERRRCLRLPQAVAWPLPTYQAAEGEYFAGQTGLIEIDPDELVVASLVNPVVCGCDGMGCCPPKQTIVYVNALSVSNLSDDPLLATIWLNLPIPQCPEPSESCMVSPTNLTVCPPPEPVAQILVSEMKPPKCCHRKHDVEAEAEAEVEAEVEAHHRHHDDDPGCGDDEEPNCKRGTPIFNRVVPPYETVVVSLDGRYILGPGNTFSVVLSAVPEQCCQEYKAEGCRKEEELCASVGYGWWEDVTR